MATWAWCIVGMFVGLIILAIVILFYWLTIRGRRKMRKVYIEPLSEEGEPPGDEGGE